MSTHPKFERTLVVIKPDGVQRNLIGEIIHRYERAGFKLVAIKMMVPTADFITKHYTLDPEWMRKTGLKTIKGYTDKGLTPPFTDPIKVTEIVLKSLARYLTSGPVIAMIWEGAHAVELIRKLTGGTEPRTSDVGTIRGDFVIDSYVMADQDVRAVRNLVHASGTVKEAEDEINHWFKKEEIIKYKTVTEQVIYDVEMKGIFE